MQGLSDEELEVYSRSIILNEIGIEGQVKLKNTKILILGAGGIASFTLPVLASSGVGSIFIADFDNLSASNLQRQVIYRYQDILKPKVELAGIFVKNLNPFVRCQTINQKLSIESFDYFLNLITSNKITYIIDTTDNFTSRSFANKLSIACKVPLFSSACIGVHIHLYRFEGYKHNKPCYHCLFSDPDDIKTCANSGVLPSAVAISGSMLANDLLKDILDLNNNQEQGYTITILNAISMQLKDVKITKDQKCKTCSA